MSKENDNKLNNVQQKRKPLMIRESTHKAFRGLCDEAGLKISREADRIMVDYVRRAKERMGLDGLTTICDDSVE